MHLRYPQVSPEKQQELDEILTIYNFSDVDFVAKARGRTYRIKAHTTRDLPAAFCYLWFGDPNLRKKATTYEAMVWDRAVRKLTHRYFIGNETHPEELFFNKYILTGKIGCRQLLEKFVDEEHVNIPESLGPAERLGYVASRFYGKTLATDDVISDGGKPIGEGDLVMFSRFTLGENEEIRTMSDAEVINFSAAMFGSNPTPTTGGGTFGVSDNPLTHPETSGRVSLIKV